MPKIWTPNQLLGLYRLDKGKSSVLRDEKRGVIPAAKRKSRGAISIRVWGQDDLPAIGKVYGFLKKPKSTRVISVYAPKGGVLKSSISFNLARMFALNGLNVLAIGLEVSQRSLTCNLESHREIESLEQATKYDERGLWDVVSDNVDIKDVIRTASLPNLHYIPESSNLNLLELKIKDAPRREYFLSKLIRPVLGNYDVVVLDNSASWGSYLVQNALVAATDILAPFACELEAYRSVVENIEILNNFKRQMELDWSSFSIVPTKVDNTKLSKEIETQYRIEFPEFVTTSTIRYLKSVAEDASMEQLSVIESNNSSPLSDDYYQLIKELWSKVLSSE